MAKRRRHSSQAVIENRIKEGRGQGKGSHYQPWLQIQDVSSKGLSSRIKGWKTGRVHHLLSKLETTYFYILEWSLSVSDIREQYPLLPLEETIAIAQQLNIPHPTEPGTGEPVVMTTDFLVTLSQNSTNSVEQARTLKYAKDLQSQRTLEKFEIERHYWQRRNIDWGIVTEKDIPTTVAENIAWLHPYLDTSLNPRDLTRIESVLSPLILQAEKTLADATAICDDQLGLEPGVSLSAVRHFLANRLWKTEMTKRIRPNKKVEIIMNSSAFNEVGVAQ